MGGGGGGGGVGLDEGYVGGRLGTRGVEALDTEWHGNNWEDPRGRKAMRCGLSEGVSVANA